MFECVGENGKYLIQPFIGGKPGIVEREQLLAALLPGDGAVFAAGDGGVARVEAAAHMDDLRVLREQARIALEGDHAAAGGDDRMGEQGGLAHDLVLAIAEVGLAAGGEHLREGHARAAQEQLVRIHIVEVKRRGKARAQRCFAAGHEAAQRDRRHIAQSIHRKGFLSTFCHHSIADAARMINQFREKA